MAGSGWPARAAREAAHDNVGRDHGEQHRDGEREPLPGEWVGDEDEEGDVSQQDVDQLDLQEIVALGAGDLRFTRNNRDPESGRDAAAGTSK